VDRNLLMLLAVCSSNNATTPSATT
jgi:hypothetical protein